MRIGSISGSLQRLVNDTSYLVAGTNVTIVSSSVGQVTISSTGGGGGGGGYEQAFNSGDLVAGVLSVAHGLPDDYVHVSVYDDTDRQIIPNEVIITGVGTLDIDLTSFSVPASPDWHVFITSANASLGGGTPAFPNNSVQYNNAGSFGGSADFTYDGKLSLTGSLIQSNGAVDTVGFMGDIAASSPSSIGSDVFFYVSGAIGSKGNSTPSVSAFGGDVVISGSMFAECSRLEVTGTVEVTNGISGSLTQLVDGTSYLIAGTGISITSQSNGSVLISNTFQQADDFFDSTIAGSIFTSGSAAFVGVDEFGVVTSPADKGTDVFFYVSGAIGSKDGQTLGVSLFGGDVSISGSLFAEGDRFEMSGTLLVTEGISGSLTQLTDGTSYLVQGTNTTIISQSNGSVVISSTPSTPSDSVQYNNAGVFGGSSNFTYNGTQVFVGGTLRVGNSAVANGSNSIASGEGSALNAYTVAHGKSTEARGENSFAHGQGTITHATNSHAEGVQTSAGEAGSHAEGYRTVSSGSYSHAEGIGTIASGSGQHVEGQYNIQGNVHSLLVVGNGTDEFDATRSDIIRVEMNSLQLTGSLWQTNSGSSTIGFMGNDSGSPEIFGTDVFFYVSGSKSSKDGPIPTVALFSGDVVVSGTLHGGSPLKVGTRLDVTGSVVTTQHYAGEVQLLTASGTDVSNLTHMTLVSSTTGEYTANLPDGLHVGQIKYILAGDITNAMVTPLITITADSVRPVMGNEWTSITFSPGDAATLTWTSQGWALLNLYGANVIYPS